MINCAKFLVVLGLLVLTACSEQTVKPDPSEQIEMSDNQKSLVKELESTAKNVPAKTTIKEGKNLNLVRAMEGGACKNVQLGISGVFLLYASQNDIDRIQNSKGTAIFREFEMNIETFSMAAFQEAVLKTDFPEHSSQVSETGQKYIFQEVIKQFRIAVEPAINAFQDESTMTIEVTPFQSSFVLYTNDCETNLNPAKQ